MRCKIEIGDPSRDGHGLSRTDIVEIDLTMEDMKQTHIELYRRGIDFARDFCSGYEDCRLLPKHQRMMIEKLFITQEEIIEFSCDYCKDDIEKDGLYTLFIDEYEITELFLFCLNKINPVLNARIVRDEIPNYEPRWVEIDGKSVFLGTMGYGCFSM